MAALTADKRLKTRGTPEGEERVAIKTSATVYVGGLASRVEATGRLKASAALDGEKFLGVIVKLEGSSGVGSGVGDAAGTEYAIVQYGHEALVEVLAAYRTSTFLGLNMFISDDQGIGGTAVGTAAARQVCGELVAFEASDKSTAWLAVKRSGVNGNAAT